MLDWREETVKKSMLKEGFDVIETDSIPTFKCINFNTGMRFSIEVKGMDEKLDYRKERKIKDLIKDGVDVKLACVSPKRILYFDLDKNLNKTLARCAGVP